MRRTVYYGGEIEKEIDFTQGKTFIRSYLPEGVGYTQETFNVAYGEDIDDDVFLKRRPDRTFSIEADLW